jgi:hypothetical protein
MSNVAHSVVDFAWFATVFTFAYIGFLNVADVVLWPLVERALARRRRRKAAAAQGVRLIAECRQRLAISHASRMGQ